MLNPILDKPHDLRKMPRHELIALMEELKQDFLSITQQLRKANLALATARVQIHDLTKALSENTNALKEKNSKIRSLTKTVVKRRKKGKKPSNGSVDWQQYFEKKEVRND